MRIFSIICFLTLSGTANCQPWKFIETKVGSNATYTLVEAYDKGLIFSVSNFDDFKNLYLYKLDVNGNLLWTRDYTYNGKYFSAFTMIELQDGGYIIGGETDIIDTVSADPYLLKLNACLEPEWLKIYHHKEEYNRIDNIQEYQGGLLVTFMGLININNITIARMDWNGNLIKKRTIKEMHYCNVVQGKAGILNVIGDAEVKGLFPDPNHLMQKSLLVTLDSNLNVLKYNYYHLNDTTFHAGSYAMCYIDQNKHNFLTSTDYRFPNRSTKDIDGSIMITKNHDDNDWNKIISDTMSYNAAQKIIRVSSNRYFLYSNHFPDPVAKPFLFYGINYIIDSNANIIYTANENQTAQTGSWSESRDAIVTYDGSIAVLGTKTSAGNFTDIYCYKYNSDLTVFQKKNIIKNYDTLCGKLVKTETLALPNPKVIRMLDDSFLNIQSILGLKDLHVSIYPNPAKEFVNIEIGTIDSLEVIIYDILGKWIATKHLNGENGKCTLDIKGLSPGSYFLLLQSKDIKSCVRLYKTE